MTERKVLIVRVKGGIGDAVAMTRYILKGLSCGVLVLPDEVISYSVEELPTPTEAGAWAWDERYIGNPPAEAPTSVIPAVEVVPLGSDEEVKMPPAPDKAVEILDELMYSKKEEAPDTDSETVPGNFKPTGANTAIKRETYARLEFDYAKYIGKPIIAMKADFPDVSDDTIRTVAEVAEFLRNSPVAIR